MTNKTTEQTTGFEGETCGGCRRWNPQTVDADVEKGQCDWSDEVGGTGHTGYEGGELCPYFKPSLQCRAVRASEEHNILKRREVEAIEGLLERLAHGLPYVVLRPDGSFVGPRDTAVATCKRCHGSGWSKECEACEGTGEARP